MGCDLKVVPLCRMYHNNTLWEMISSAVLKSCIVQSGRIEAVPMC
jgi:hypothetical protein